MLLGVAENAEIEPNSKLAYFVELFWFRLFRMEYLKLRA